MQDELDNDKVNVGVTNECDMVGVVSDDDNDCANFNYDNVFDIAFDDSNDNDDFVEEEMDNLIDYDNAKKGTSKKNEKERGS